MLKTTLTTIAIAIMITACDKGTEGKAAGAAGTSAPASGATTSLTKKQLDEAFKLTDPDKYDKSVTAVTGQLGKPQKSDDTSSVWYAADGGNCYKLLLTKAKGNESGSTENSNCGLK
jgi:hypothetical protein